MKKLFLSLLLWFVWLISFSSADELKLWEYWQASKNELTQYINTWGCFTFNNNSTCWRGFKFVDWNWIEIFRWQSSFNYSYNYYCTNTWGYIKPSSNDCWWLIFYPSCEECEECEECETCPEVNTWDILSWSCDTNYCVENDLCPVPGNFSQLFINDLEFPWSPLINVNIPDYIQWDYTSNSWSFDLYVWSWYDVDYMNSIIKINSYRPDSQDFTDTFVSWLTLIFPYIFVALLIIFIWKLLKRIFK